MSNIFRIKIKKKRGLGGPAHEKKNSDPSGILSGSHVQIVGPAEPKRKTVSVTTPPDLSSPSHQTRKVSLTAESPIHASNRSTPTSPLVNAKQSGALCAPRSDPLSSSLSGGTSNGGMMFASSLPKVNVAMEDAPLDRQGIIDITGNIQSFMAAISKLKKAMEDAPDVQRTSTQSPDSLTNSEAGGDSSEGSDEVLEHLTDLIEVVQTCLSEHSAMQSTEIRDAAKALSETFADCKHDSPASCQACTSCLEALITAFTNSVSEYLTGDSPTNESYGPPPREMPTPRKGGLDRPNLKGLSKSHDNLSPKYSSFVDLAQPFSEPILEDIDHALFAIENSTDVAAKYIKMRMKYHKEIVTYLSKRAQIEQRYMNSMINLGKKTLSSLQEMRDEHPPALYEVFKKSVEEDIRLSTSFNQTFNQKVSSTLIEPMESKMQECEKKKKEMTTNWNKEKKKLNEAKTAMRNAMSRYRFLGQDLARVKNLLALDPYGKQAEKRKKEVSDLENKWQEAEQTYKKAVADCNDCQYQVHIAAQKSILCAYRRLVIDCDIQLQSGLEAYFRLQRDCFHSLPEPVDTLLEMAGEYQIGSEFMSYISKHPEQREEPEDYLFEEFDPESENLMEANENYMDSSGLPNSTSTDSTFLNPGAEEVHERASSPFPSSQGYQDAATPTHNLSSTGDLSRGAGSGLNASSPRMSKKRSGRPHSELMEGTGPGDKNPLTRRNSDHSSIQASTKDSLSPPAAAGVSQPSLQQQQSLPQEQRQQHAPDQAYSKNALTHTFKKLRGPARCRECDTYVYFHGHECEVCGLACHKKCLENLAIRCGNKRLARKMNLFGVDFHKHLKATNRCIPIIVTKCIEEIDERALDTRGLYRISSAKTKLEHLCQLFESGADRVDLSDRPSHLIGSCLKLYFRQLPEPLLTFQYYHSFITFARECAYVLPCNLETVSGEKKERALEMLNRLRGLLQKLPFENYITLARLLYHLKKVSAPEHVKHNSMPPSNLGIVFGPNLLRQREMVASLALLADMTAQAKAIEIMISHAYDLFQMTEEKIKEHEHERDDDNFTQEMLVGEDFFDPPEPIKSPLLDVDDYMTAGSRTPYNTPPERRRENLYELGGVLEALQSMGKKTSEGDPGSPMDSLRGDNPMSASMPNFSPLLSLTKSTESASEESTLATLSRYLRSSPAATTPNPLEKMLTPVEERPSAEHDNDHSIPPSDDEDDNLILSSSSNKLDGPLSRSGSTFSTPGPAFFIDAEKDASWEERSTDDKKGRGIRTLDDQKELSSQSSEDSNAFEDNLPEHMRAMLTEIATSAQETPQQRSLDSGRQRHSVLSTSEVPSPFQRTNRGGGSPQKSQSLRGRYSGVMQHPQPTSSNSYSFLNTGSASFSERSNTKKKYSISEKYAKYERCRSEKELYESGTAEGSEEKQESKDSSQPTEDADVAVTEDGVASGAMDEAEDTNQPSDADRGSYAERDSDDEHGSDEEDGNKVEVEDSPLAGSELLNKRLLEVRELSSITKQCDSGIDDTPDSSKSFRDGVRRLSMPPSGEDVQMTDDKPLSHVAAFASRESGISDSPVPETLSDDSVFPKPQKSPLLQHHSSPLLQSNLTDDEKERSGKLEEDVDIPLGSPDSKLSSKEAAHETHPETPRYSSCVEIVVPEESDDVSDTITPNVRRRVYSSFSTDRDRGSSVPRSLESPTFSRYARTPIRDSKLLLRASDGLSVSGLRYRSVSMDKIPTSYMDSNKSLQGEDNFSDFRQKVCSDSSRESGRRGIPGSKNPSISCSMSTSFVPYYSPSESLDTVESGANSGATSKATYERTSEPTSEPTSEARSGVTSGKLASSIDGHPNARYCVNSPPESTTPQTSPSHSLHPTTIQSAPSTPLSQDNPFLSSPATSPANKRKNKLGKGLKKKLKPALRVFKITSGASNLTPPSEILHRAPPLEEEEEGSTDNLVASVKSTPPAFHDLEQTSIEGRRRVRMVSPEAVDMEGKGMVRSSNVLLRRSRSSEDILDVSLDDEEEDDEEQSGETKIGDLVVVPEHSKQKTRGKMFLSKMKRKRTGSNEYSPQLSLQGSEVGKGIAGEPEQKGSPALLAYGFLAQPDGSGLKNPKNAKKRQRTPQYV